MLKSDRRDKPAVILIMGVILMKIDLGMGDSWRVTFKRSMWVSVVLFEIAAIVLSIWFSNIAAAWHWVSGDGKAVFVVIGIIIGTILNEMVHALWACAAYMFEDIARNRAASERIAELLEIQENRLSGEEPGKASAVANRVAVKQTSNSGRIRSVSERIAQNDKSDNAPAEWACPECGRLNPMTASFCKDCGRYK